MSRKRYAEVVVSIPKDTPLVCVHLVSVIWKGKYIPAAEMATFRNEVAKGYRFDSEAVKTCHFL